MTFFTFNLADYSRCVAILALNLWLAHLIADFWLQTRTMVEEKKTKVFGSWRLYFHSLEVALLSWAFVGRMDFVWCALILFLTHTVYDISKVLFASTPLRAFLGDQFLHLIVICWISGKYAESHLWKQWGFIPDEYALLVPLVSCMTVVVTMPANIVISGIMESRKVKNLKTLLTAWKEEDLVRMIEVGALIGTLERLLTFFFVLRENYQAVGFIMAAKSILRFKESEGARAEYVLVGTLMSVAIAVACALVVLMARKLGW